MAAIDYVHWGQHRSDCPLCLRAKLEKLIDEHVFAVALDGEAWVDGIDGAVSALLDEYDLTERAP